MEHAERTKRLMVGSVALLATGVFGMTWYCQGTTNELERQEAENNRPISSLFAAASERAEAIHDGMSAAPEPISLEEAPLLVW